MQIFSPKSIPCFFNFWNHFSMWKFFHFMKSKLLIFFFYITYLPNVFNKSVTAKASKIFYFFLSFIILDLTFRFMIGSKVEGSVLPDWWLTLALSVEKTILPSLTCFDSFARSNSVGPCVASALCSIDLNAQVLFGMKSHACCWTALIMGIFLLELNNRYSQIKGR